MFETNKVESQFSCLLLNYKFLEVVNSLHFNAVKQIFMSTCSIPRIMQKKDFCQRTLLGGTGKSQ